MGHKKGASFIVRSEPPMLAIYDGKYWNYDPTKQNSMKHKCPECNCGCWPTKKIWLQPNHKEGSYTQIKLTEDLKLPTDIPVYIDNGYISYFKLKSNLDRFGNIIYWYQQPDDGVKPRKTGVY
jgi:hypothetical protein